MFQYATGRALAARLELPLLIDTSLFDRYSLHRYGLDRFRLSASEALPAIRLGGRAWVGLRRVGITPERYLRWKRIRLIQEPENLSYVPELLTPSRPTNVYLDGYWQNERYFADHAELIRAELSPNLPLGPKFDAQRLAIKSSTSVSLHIRRGDYVTDVGASSIHGALMMSYYKQAVDYFEQKLGETFRLVVFSDDIPWARENLRFRKEMIFVQGSTGVPHEDLFLMAACNHHIVANSSFSWWAAWLNADPHKIVIAPSQWFKSEQLSSVSICPSTWVRL